MIITKRKNYICPFCGETINKEEISLAIKGIKEGGYKKAVIICDHENPYGKMYGKHVYCVLDNECKGCKEGLKKYCRNHHVKVELPTPLTRVAERYK